MSGFYPGLNADNPPVSKEELEAYVAKDVPFEMETLYLSEQGVELGLKKDRERGMHIAFSHRAYADREESDQEDYDRLLVSVFHQGILRPVITWRDPDTHVNHVLIGMRRVEIALRMGVETVKTARVLEDVREWWRYDAMRLERMKEQLDLFGVSY